MKKTIQLFFLVLFSISYGQVSKESKKKSNTSIPVSINRATDDSIMRSRGGISSEDGQTWSIPNDITSGTTPEKEDIKIYERKEVEVPAEFKGGIAKMNQFIDENFVVSQKIKDKKINGELALSFVVEKDGSLTGFKTIKNLGSDTAKELERVVKLQKWYPAELNGKKVRSTFNLTHTINKQ